MLDLSLKTTWIVYPLISIEANSNYDAEQPIDDAEFDIKHLLEIDDSDPSFLRLHFGFAMPEHPGRNLEYFINIKLFATFSISKDLRAVKPEIAKEVILDIISLALGGIRELVATTTSRGPWNTYIIPFIDIEEIVQNLMTEVLGSVPNVKKQKRNKGNVSPT